MTETLHSTIPDDIEEAAHSLLETACDRGLLLATAESCTGGLLASLLTDVEGASHIFERGFVVYSNEAKCELLKVEKDTIDDCGAVSARVARAMAQGALAASKADIAVSITGYAGSAGPGQEPGLVHFACAKRGGRLLEEEAHFGDIGRGAVRLASLRVALSMMKRIIE